MDIQWIDLGAGATYDALDETLQTHLVRKIWYIVDSQEDVPEALRELALRDYTVVTVSNAADARRFVDGYANVALTTKDELAVNENEFKPLSSSIDVLVMDSLGDHAAFACLRWWRRERPTTLHVLWA
jgi:hypothetical protein